MFGPMVEVDPSSSMCANCEYWKGFRKKHESGQKAMVDGNATGKCSLKASPWYDQVQLAMSTCVSWMKWTMLK